MSFKAAFIFVAPEVEYEQHQAVINTPVVELHVAGVKDYQEAVSVARALQAQGVTAFELCAGFGVQGTAMLKHALGASTTVGVVRFDSHPGLGHQSGDALFMKA